MQDEAQSVIKNLKMQFGEHEFDERLRRWRGIECPPIGLVEEYAEKAQQIAST